PENPLNDDSLAVRQEAGIMLFAAEELGNYRATWALPGDRGERAVLFIDLQKPIAGDLHDLTIKFYLIGFGAALAVIFLALLGTRTLKRPLRQVEEAMTAIDRRRHGFRLKVPEGQEFAEAYRKVNRALVRLEQLDSVQRSAVQRRNALANELKTISRFLDVLAHEIKNPLHALGINVDVLKTKIQREKPRADILKHAKILERELEHLQEVVQGFLNFVRPGVPQKERTQLNSVVREVIQLAGPEAQKRKIKVEARLAKSLRHVTLDPRQMQQALHNVLINAVHASYDGGKIVVRTWQKGNRVLVSVKDEGMGMSKADLKKVFELYYTTKKGGTGLGLPITKRLVEANGGELQVESAQGKGTTVTMMFRTR
ncbi:MAG: sensor histidine kinase, partial [Calditrichaeota bacterium]